MGISKKELLKYMGPGIIGLLFNSIYIVVDGIFVANMLGPDALAAVTVVVPVVEVLIALSLMISIGGGVYIAIHRGLKNLKTSRSYFNHGLILTLVFSSLITVGALIFRNPIVRMLGATDRIHEQGVEYFIWFIVFVPFFMLNYALGTWVRNDGKPGLAMAGQIIGAVLNVFLDYIFMGPMKMGLKGAAIATGLGPVIGIIILLPHFLGKQGDLYIAKTKIKFKYFKDILLGGLPSFSIEFSLGLTTFFCNLFLSKTLMENGLAAFGVVGYLNLILLSLFLGMGQGTQPLVSQYHGSGDKENVKYIYNFSIKVSIAIGVIGYALLFFFKAPLTSIFINRADETLFSMTLHAINLFFVGIVFTGINITAASLFEATQKVFSSILISLGRSAFFLVPALWILSTFFPPHLIWLGVPIAEFFTLFLTFYLQKRKKRKPSSL